MKKVIFAVALLSAALGFVLLPQKAAAQSTQERCVQGACYAYGPPAGTCVGAFIYSDISQTPVTQYACKAGAWSATGSASPTATSNLLLQIPTNGLIGLYTHADCTNPYKDYSAAGNNGAVIGGVTQPTCSPNGLSYFLSGSLNAWALPSAVTSAGLTYIFSVLPLVTANTIGVVNQGILQSSTTGGTLNLFGDGALVGNPGTVWSPQMGFNASYSISSSNSTMPAAAVVAYEIGTGVAGDKDQEFVNGNEVTYSHQGSTTLAAFNVGTMQVGGSTVSGGFDFFGLESVTAVYSRKLTAAEQAQVSNALANFTQIRTGMMYPVPGVTSQLSQVVCDGDSISYGVGVSNSWCSTALLSVGETIVVTNTSTPGKWMAAIAGKMPQEVTAYLSPQANRNTIYLHAGTNDVTFGLTAQNTWNFTARAASHAHTNNSKLIMMPMISRTGSDANKNALNALFNAQCAQVADLCIAPDDPLLFADGASANATYFQGDGIHPTTAGDTLLALYASNAYKQLYGSTLWAPTQVSAATYTVLASDNYITATANSVITLYNCLGYSQFVHVKVLPGLTVTVKNATAAQTIDGVDRSSAALSLTAGSNYQFQVVPGTTAAGGCTWIIN
jgi:lysophospholipase L1-like esterase